MTNVRTRFAPSPTGALHIGSLRTALYSYALAKHEKGDFILRIEDTDIKREIPGSKERIEELLKLFGINWDEHYVQSERAKEGIYEEAARKLVKEGHAFFCDCKPRNAKEEGYSKELRDPCREAGKTAGAVKLKVPEGETISFKDFVLDKEVSWETSTVADTTLLKSDGFPTYHLAVVVDDHDMGISHVLRGHDWMPSTPVHLLVYKYLGYDLPQIGHLTDILDPEGGKLSKRKGSTTVDELLKEGYLPEAILNFIMLLGWAPKDNRELFTLGQFVEAFDPNGFQKTNPVFNREKLDWFNGHYIRNKPLKELTKQILEYFEDRVDPQLLEKVLPLVRPRIRTLAEIETLAGFILNKKAPEPISVTPYYSSNISGATLSRLENIKATDWKVENINNAFGGASDQAGTYVGDFYMDLRGTISGSKVTPPINESIEILGKKETIKRIKRGIEKYNK